MEQHLEYYDPEQNVVIDLKADFQHLYGDKAEELFRFREGDVQRYLRRIQIQQDFMKAVMKKYWNLNLC